MAQIHGLELWRLDFLPFFVELRLSFHSDLAHGRFVGVFLLVHGHRGVLHERVLAVGSGAVEVPVDLVAGTVRQSAVDVPVVKLEAVQDFDVVVEVLAVHDQYVFLVGHVKATVLVAVVVGGTQVRAQVVRAFGVFAEHFEALQTIILNLKHKTDR